MSVAEVDRTTEKELQIGAISGISRLNNFQHNDDGTLTVFRQYGIGPGKVQVE